MKHQTKQLLKAILLSPFAIIPLVSLIALIAAGHSISKGQPFNIFDVGTTIYLLFILFGTIIAFVGVLIFMLPTYYISQKFNLKTYKVYMLVGGLFGSLFGLQPSLGELSFLPALFYMCCGLVVSFTFWHIAVKRL